MAGKSASSQVDERVREPYERVRCDLVRPASKWATLSEAHTAAAAPQVPPSSYLASNRLPQTAPPMVQTPFPHGTHTLSAPFPAAE